MEIGAKVMDNGATHRDVCTVPMRVTQEEKAPMSSSAPNPIWDLPSVQIQIANASSYYADVLRVRSLQFLKNYGRYQRTESPIEAIFWIWWSTIEALTLDQCFPFSLVPQHEVQCDGTVYRLDFAIPEYLIAVELDGHEFHEKTKEQVTYRNQRDRQLQAAGWTVFHFSGSELYRGQVDVVTSVANLALERAGLLPSTAK